MRIRRAAGAAAIRTACSEPDVRESCAAAAEQIGALVLDVLVAPMLRDWAGHRRCCSVVARAARGVQRQGDQPAADLRRPGRDRDRERAAVQRDQGRACQGRGAHARAHRGAGLPDRDQRRAPVHQRVADRRGAGVRGDPGERDAALRQPARPPCSVTTASWCIWSRRTTGRPRRSRTRAGCIRRRPTRGMLSGRVIMSGSVQTEEDTLPTRTTTRTAARLGPLAAHDRRAAAQGRRGRRRDHRRLARPGPDAAAADRPAEDLRRPGGDRHRERAPVQRDAGGAGAADRHRRSAAGDQQLGGGRGAGVRQDPRQLRSTCSRPSSWASCWSTTTARCTSPAWRGIGARRRSRATFPRPLERHDDGAACIDERRAVHFPTSAAATDVPDAVRERGRA